MRLRTGLAVAFTALVALAPLAAVPARAGQTAAAADPVAAESVAAAPKVVIVVGATESTTASYRTMADSIAAEAIKWTPNVVKVYSPNATWAAVRAAAQGASIFVYLGHGFGFPSPYGATLNPSTEDGMGLNTTLGVGDSDKQYYGESVVAAGIRFADDAVVLLNHLCYAPGAGEPGAPEPTISVAEQRVDNFASGFIRAGARVVVADDYTTSMQGAIRAIFTSHQSMLSMWRTLAGYHGNEIPFTPTRNPSFQAVLDPETWTTGFTRSIVTDPGFTTDDVLAGAGHPATGTAATLTAPGAASVVTSGLVLDTDQDLATPAGSTLAAGTKLRVDAIVPGTPGGDGTTPPPAVQVHTIDGALSGWVSGAGLAPGDATSPELWALGGATTVSPNFDGNADRLDLWGRLSEAAPWTWTLRDPDGNVVRSQSGATDLFGLSWDALPAGHPAAAGTYHWTFHADDGWGNPPLDVSGDVTVLDLPVPPSAVLSFTSLSGADTSATTLAFQLTFATDVTGLTAADFVRSGTATGCVVGAPTGGPTVWYVTIASCSAGTVSLSLNAGSVLDATLVAGPPAATAGPTVRIDRTRPVAAAPRASLRTGGSASSAMAFTVTWSATDSGGAGIASYDVARSVDGAAFIRIASGTTATSLVQSLTSGHHYRFEVRARDRAGNLSAYVAGPTLGPLLVQQTSTSVRWSSGWNSATNPAFSGGSAKTTTTPGASFTYTFSGRGIGLVMSRDASYGQVNLFVDGAFVGTLDTGSTSYATRIVVFARSLSWATHTLRVVNVGTVGRARVVVDAFEVIR
jgi:hypothetical protein